MPDGLRKATFVVLFLVLSTFAHAPLAQAGFLGKDVRALSDQATRPPTREAASHWRGDGEQRPLATHSLALSRRIWSDAGRWTEGDASALRIESLLWLWACAAGLGLALRRALLPWTGSAAAAAAGAASALLLACHPLSVAVVAHPGSRADLIAIALASTALALFLRARQEREPRFLPVAIGLALLAGFASPAAWLLPPIAAGLELASARRYRPWHVRLRTGSTTLAVFAGAVVIEGLAAALAGVRSFGADGLLAFFLGPGTASDAASRVEHGIEQLGLLVVPLSTATAGAFSFVVAAALALIALQPALAAARSAPRLWGSILLSFAAALVVALLLRSDVRVTPSEFAHADALLAATSVASAGLAITATAVSGARRAVVPLAVAIGYAVLAHASARAWPVAAAELATLRADLELAREMHGRDASFLVLDPPEVAVGLAIVGDALELAFDPAFTDPGPDGAADWVRGLPRAAFPAWTREPDFERRRAGGLVVLRPPDEGARRTSLLLATPEPSTGPTFWRAENRSPLLDLDPFEKRALRVSLLPGAPTGDVPRASWRGRDVENGECDGAWVEGAEGPLALFDLASSFEWSAGRRILRLRVRDESEEIVSVEVLEELPRIGIEAVEAQGGNLRIRLATSSGAPRVLHGEGRFVLCLLETGRYLYAELEPGAGGADELVFPSAGVFPAPRTSTGDVRAPLAWSLEYRVGAVAVARSTGRIAGG